jgi:hypothetical protein
VDEHNREGEGQEIMCFVVHARNVKLWSV